MESSLLHRVPVDFPRPAPDDRTKTLRAPAGEFADALTSRAPPAQSKSASVRSSAPFMPEVVGGPSVRQMVCSRKVTGYILLQMPLLFTGTKLYQ
jgi:hypothetical protein